MCPLLKGFAGCCTHLPAFVMIISVPASWNFFHSSRSWRTTLMFSMFWKRSATTVTLCSNPSKNRWSRIHLAISIRTLPRAPHLTLWLKKEALYLVGLGDAGNGGSCGQIQSWLLWKEIRLNGGLDPAHASIRHSWNLLLQHLCRINKILSCQIFFRHWLQNVSGTARR